MKAWLGSMMGDERVLTFTNGQGDFATLTGAHLTAATALSEGLHLTAAIALIKSKSILRPPFS